MHPAVAGYISTMAYEGKLRANDACQIQAFHDDPPWPTAGLVYVPVIQAGTTRPLSGADVLVV